MKTEKQAEISVTGSEDEDMTNTAASCLQMLTASDNQHSLHSYTHWQQEKWLNTCYSFKAQSRASRVIHRNSIHMRLMSSQTLWTASFLLEEGSFMTIHTQYTHSHMYKQPHILFIFFIYTDMFNPLIGHK